jgi:hypothetical protein
MSLYIHESDPDLGFDTAAICSLTAATIRHHAEVSQSSVGPLAHPSIRDIKLKYFRLISCLHTSGSQVGPCCLTVSALLCFRGESLRLADSSRQSGLTEQDRRFVLQKQKTFITNASRSRLGRY